MKKLPSVIVVAGIVTGMIACTNSSNSITSDSGVTTAQKKKEEAVQAEEAAAKQKELNVFNMLIANTKLENSDTLKKLVRSDNSRGFSDFKVNINQLKQNCLSLSPSVWPNSTYQQCRSEIEKWARLDERSQSVDESWLHQLFNYGQNKISFSTAILGGSGLQSDAFSLPVVDALFARSIFQRNLDDLGSDEMAKPAAQDLKNAIAGLDRVFSLQAMMNLGVWASSAELIIQFAQKEAKPALSYDLINLSYVQGTIIEFFYDQTIASVSFQQSLKYSLEKALGDLLDSRNAFFKDSIAKSKQVSLEAQLNEAVASAKDVTPRYIDRRGLWLKAKKDPANEAGARYNEAFARYVVAYYTLAAFAELPKKLAATDPKFANGLNMVQNCRATLQIDDGYSFVRSTQAAPIRPDLLGNKLNFQLETISSEPFSKFLEYSNLDCQSGPPSLIKKHLGALKEILERAK